MSYIDENGLSIPTQDEVARVAKDRLIAKLQGSLRDDPDGVSYRTLVSMLSEAKSEALASVQAAVAGLMPGTSTGEFLTEMLRFNGIDRNESKYSTVTLELTANAGPLNTGADTAVASTVAGDEYIVTEPVSLAPFASGTFSARSVTKGRFVADAGKITEIVTPIYGWGSVTNPVVVTPGESTELDPAARRRRWGAARGVGLHHESAIKRSLEDLDGVEAAAVVRTERGIVWPIVWGGDPQEIADTLFGVGTAQLVSGAGSVGAGIETTGSTSVPVTDAAAGQSGTINYTQGSDIPIYVRVITQRLSGYPSNGNDRIKSAIVAFFEGNLTIDIDGVETVVDPYEPGQDVAGARLYTAANTVPNHIISSILVGISDPPGVTVQEINHTHRAVTSTALINVIGAGD